MCRQNVATATAIIQRIIAADRSIKILSRKRKHQLETQPQNFRHQSPSPNHRLLFNSQTSSPTPKPCGNQRPILIQPYLHQTYCFLFKSYCFQFKTYQIPPPRTSLLARLFQFLVISSLKMNNLFWNCNGINTKINELENFIKKKT